MAAPTAVIDHAYITPVGDLVAQFDQAMDVASATNPDAYEVRGSVGVVPVDSVTYDPATHQVTFDLNGGAPLVGGNYSLRLLADQIENVAGESYRHDPDIAVSLSNLDFGKLPVNRGLGTGGFQISDVLVAGRNPEHMATADVNGDGHPDLITTQLGRNGLYIYLSQPAGGYALPNEYTVGSSMTSVAAADLNGDGRADIVISLLDNLLAVMLSDGTGGFSMTNYATADRAKSVALGDFDEDGTADVAVSVENRGVEFLFNPTGDGNFSNASNRATVFANTPSGIVAADVDQDGFLDIAAAGPVSRSTTVLYGRSGRAFDVVETSTPGFSSSEVAVGDVNGDGVNDLVMASNASQQIALLTGGSNPRQFAVSQIFTLGNTPSGLAIADLNHDGFDDVLVSTDNTNSRLPISVLPGETAGLGPRDFVSPGAYGPAYDIVVGEFDPLTNVGSFFVDATAPTVTLGIDAVTTDTTPEVTITVADNYPVLEGAIVYVDIDLNNDGDFGDAGETAYTTSQLAGGSATFELSPALSIGSYAARARASDRAGNEGFSGDKPFRIASPNNPPTAVDDEFVVERNRTDVLLDLLANDSTSPDTGEQLAIIAATSPNQGGSVVIAPNGGSLRYTPVAGFVGTEQFTYTISDGNGGEDQAVVVVHVNTEANDVIRFQLHAVNAAGQPISRVPVGETLLVRVTAEDVRSNPTGVFAAYVDVFYASHLLHAESPAAFGPAFPNGQSYDLTREGVVDELGGFGGFSPTGAGARIVATIPFLANTVGFATLTTDLADLVPGHDSLVYLNNRAVPADQIDFGSLAIEIIAAVDAVDDSYRAQEDSIDNVLTLLDNDFVSSGRSLSIVQLSSPDQGGQAEIAPDGRSVIYTPRPDFVGVESFTYVVDDGNGATDEATVVVRVDDVNDPPTAIDDYVPDLQEDSVANRIEVLSNDDTATDVGESLTVIRLGATSHGGSVAISADSKAVLYSPTPDFFGKETFTYAISDGNGGEAQATVTVEVLNVNDDPIATDDTYMLTKGATTAALAVLANDSILPDVGESLAIAAIGATSQGGSAVISADGKRILYTAPPDFAGVDTFTYTISDGNGGSDTATVTVTVATPWQNYRNHLDVNDDSHVTPIDALLIINDLHSRGPRLLPVPATQLDGQWLFIDTNGDGYVSPIDALLVINYLNGMSGGEGEAFESDWLALLSGVAGERDAGDEIFGTLAPVDNPASQLVDRSSDATSRGLEKFVSSHRKVERDVDTVFESIDDIMCPDDMFEALAMKI